MRFIVVDSETDNLQDVATKVWVLGWSDDGVNFHTTNNYDEMRKVLSGDFNERRLVCHNAVRFDLVVFNRLLGMDLSYLDFVDTLPLSWTINYQRDKHGLESYGETFGVPKPKITDWEGLTYEEYAHRVTEDVKINWLLWQDLQRKLNVLYDKDGKEILRYINYLNYKMDMAREQEANPITVDLVSAQKHLTELERQRDEKYVELLASMPKVAVMETKSYPKKPTLKDGGLSAQGIKWQALLASLKLPLGTVSDVTYVKEYIEPNPQSDVQVKAWLTDLGWQCKTFKFDRNKVTGETKQIPQIRYPKGHPSEGELCEEVVELGEKDPAVYVLAGLSIIKHRVGFFQGFIDNHKEGKLVASIEGLTNTLRFKHRKPLANIPGVDKPWGKEIRSCIIAPEGYVICGSDMVSLEDNTKRHYIQPHDPEYVAEMQQEGYDPHLSLAVFAGAMTKEQYIEHTTGIKKYNDIRKPFKVTNYSSTYGIREKKLARDLNCSVAFAKSLLDAFWAKNWAVQKVAQDCEVKHTGQSMWLKNPVSGFWYQLRAEKDRFSTLNQGTGVYCFDTWIYNVRKLGCVINFQFHDEKGSVVKVGQEQWRKDLLEKAMERTNDTLQLNVPLGIDVKFGKTYSEVH
jgi:hypothetical protein